eukprot:UN15679
MKQSRYVRLLVDSGCQIWPERYSMKGRNLVGEALLYNAYTRDKVKTLLEKTQFIDGKTLFELVYARDFLDFLFLSKRQGARESCTYRYYMLIC